MKNTFRERVVFYCSKKTKEHRWLAKPLMVYMAVALSAYHLCLAIAHNCKKIYAVGFFCMLFFVTTSFNFNETHSVLDLELDVNGLQLVDDASATVEVDIDALVKEEEEDVIIFEEVQVLDQTEIDIYTIEDILEANENASKVPESETVSTPLNGSQFDPNDWNLILVNKQHPIPDGYEFPLGTIRGNLKCDERILQDLLSMVQAAKKDGIALNICSPYRDFNRQTALFEAKIDKYLSRGLSYIDAYRVASQLVTAPNASEHQLGLAVDINTSSHPNLNAAFAKTDAGKWLKAHSFEYGFILRYPEGKEYITGIDFEPWHFRYVGVEAATFITEQEITLEEFWEDYLD